MAASSCGSDRRRAEPVERLQQIEFAALFGQRELLVVDERHQLLRVEVLADDLIGAFDLARDERALMHGREERAVPQRRAHRGRHIGAQHDVAGQVLVVAAETVGEPGAHRRPAHLDVPGVHHEHRRLVIRDVGVHRSNDADVIRATADVREELTHLQPALAVAREREGRLHERAGLALGGHRIARQRLPVVLRQHRLGVEAVDLRQTAVHEQEDDVFRAGRVMQSLGELRRAGLALREARGGE